eukprot:350103-Amorphochlora_amoeboformis.AAC.2
MRFDSSIGTATSPPMVSLGVRDWKVFLQVVVGKILNPAEITYRELAVGTVCGIQIYGAFVVGEMWGRMSIVGYTPGKKAHH